MNAATRRDNLVRSLTTTKQRLRLPHVVRWRALARLRDCLTPLIQAAHRGDEAEITRLRREIVDLSHIAQYWNTPSERAE